MSEEKEVATQPDLDQLTSVYLKIRDKRSELKREFEAQDRGFTTVKHQREVGVSYFDIIAEAVGATSTVANKTSTEHDQF